MKKMVNETKLELIEQFRNMVIFQKQCLDMGNWEDYDKVETEIKKLEEQIASEE